MRIKNYNKHHQRNQNNTHSGHNHSCTNNEQNPQNINHVGTKFVHYTTILIIIIYDHDENKEYEQAENIKHYYILCSFNNYFKI